MRSKETNPIYFQIKFILTMILLLMLIGVVGFAVLLYGIGPRVTKGRKYADERMRGRIASTSWSSMRPRDDKGTTIATSAEKWRRITDLDDDIAP